MNELFTPQLGPLLLHALLSGLLGLFIYVLFRLSWRFLVPIVRRPQLKKLLTRWLPLVEILVWVSFVLLSMGYLIAANFVPGLIFSLILIGGFWPYLLNLMSGMVIRMNNRFRVGQRARINSYKGTISRLGLMELDLEIDGGQTVVIPYNQIPRSSVILDDPEEEIASYVVELSTNPAWSVGETQQQILEKVLILPWTSTGRLPTIEPVIHGVQQAHYRVVLYSSHHKYFPQMAQILEKHFQYSKVSAPEQLLN